MMMLTRTMIMMMNNSFSFVFAFFWRVKILQKVFTFLTCLHFADRWLIRGQSSAAKTFRRSRLDEDELTASRELTTPVHSYSQRGFIRQKIPRFLQKSSLYFIFKECCWYLKQLQFTHIFAFSIPDLQNLKWTSSQASKLHLFKNYRPTDWWGWRVELLARLKTSVVAVTREVQL